MKARHAGRGAWLRRLAPLLSLAALAAPAPAQAPACSRADFEAVVAQVAVALKDLNQANRPAFQAKLRTLKEKRGWSQDDFLKLAAPIVQDETITAYDRKTSEALDRINGMSVVAGGSDAADCDKLGELKGHMTALIDLQKERWRYMFSRLDAELAKAP